MASTATSWAVRSTPCSARRASWPSARRRRSRCWLEPASRPSPAADAARYAELAALTALVFAGISVLAWAFRLSSLVAFISETNLLGFKAGAAITIATTQLPKLFGVKGGGEHFVERLSALVGQLPETNLAVLGFGLVAIAVLLLGERFLPGRPIALVVVVASVIVLSLTPLAELGFKTVGALPSGLPELRLPLLRLARRGQRASAGVRLLPAGLHRERLGSARPGAEERL